MNQMERTEFKNKNVIVECNKRRSICLMNSFRDNTPLEHGALTPKIHSATQIYSNYAYLGKQQRCCGWNNFFLLKEEKPRKERTLSWPGSHRDSITYLTVTSPSCLQKITILNTIINENGEDVITLFQCKVDVVQADIVRLLQP
ncbi:hypothetical protein TcasGA2_TC000512 [Tribolium castaneum]|uniref:Uncharacterized protein n=1 Tax=Tribolium castaneum TaxID=7070 RepID=D6W9W6_TRICA|nr:hypothetical protein TcasGA2_TC000512 [Tribolium castaneum]